MIVPFLPLQKHVDLLFDSSCKTIVLMLSYKISRMISRLPMTENIVPVYVSFFTNIHLMSSMHMPCLSC